MGPAFPRLRRPVRASEDDTFYTVFHQHLLFFRTMKKCFPKVEKKFEQKIRAMAVSANQESVFSFPPPNKEANVQKDKSTNQ